MLLIMKDDTTDERQSEKNSEPNTTPAANEEMTQTPPTNDNLKKQ